MKTKQLQKGLEQLTDEGVAQLFTRKVDGRKIIGTVGALQFEVIQHRLKAEYNASATFDQINLYKALWISCSDKKKVHGCYRWLKKNFLKLNFILRANFNFKVRILVSKFFKFKSL
jgi:peptide subunit release factor RF-3